MARTISGVNDAKAVKRYAGLLAYDTSQKSYWNQRFMARSHGPGQAAGKAGQGDQQHDDGFHDGLLGAGL